MKHHLKPPPFSTHHQWYKSYLQSLTSSNKILFSTFTTLPLSVLLQIFIPMKLIYSANLILSLMSMKTLFTPFKQPVPLNFLASIISIHGLDVLYQNWTMLLKMLLLEFLIVEFGPSLKVLVMWACQMCRPDGGGNANRHLISTRMCIAIGNLLVLSILLKVVRPLAAALRRLNRPGTITVMVRILQAQLQVVANSRFKLDVFNKLSVIYRKFSNYLPIYIYISCQKAGFSWTHIACRIHCGKC